VETEHKNDDISHFGLNAGPKANITPTPDIYQIEASANPSFYRLLKLLVGIYSDFPYVVKGNPINL
jgi:hypothetical protein